MKRVFVGWMKRVAVVGMAMVMSTGAANAGTVLLTSVMLDSIGIINVTALGHQAGNLEIKVTGGFGSVEGVTCDPNYIATRNTGEGFKDTLALLMAAHVAKKPLHMYITDDPALSAFGGRCSLVAVVMN
ncbi:MAG: hypothetical protein ACI8WB_001004 [Phenylobacterium sp.]|jgi:hypothetical protein